MEYNNSGNQRNLKVGITGVKDPTEKTVSPEGEAPYTHGSQSSPVDSPLGNAVRASVACALLTESSSSSSSFDVSVCGKHVSVEDSLSPVG